MLELDWRLHDADGVTLVAVVVENTAPTPRRVRIKSRLDAPVQPPRRRGLPERGWEKNGYEGLVPAGDRLGVGFACLAEPAEPPVEIVVDERADVDPPDSSTDPALGTDVRTGIAGLEDPSPTDVLCELGSPAPPRDAVPDSEPAAALPRNDDEVEPADQNSRDSRATGEIPDPVATWLADVDARIEHAERLAGSRELTAAADAVVATGGLVGVEKLLVALAADRAALRAFARDAELLAERGDVLEDVPLDTYRRLS